MSFSSPPHPPVPSGKESPVAGEGGEGPSSEGESAGGAEEKTGGAAAEGRETSITAGGEAETETREEQGEKKQTSFQNLLSISTGLM